MNRIIGNVIIVDSAMGNSFILNSANIPVHLTKLSVNAFTITAASGGYYEMRLSETDTTSVVVVITASNSLLSFSGTPQQFNNLKVTSLINGTGFIYLA